MTEMRRATWHGCSPLRPTHPFATEPARSSWRNALKLAGGINPILHRTLAAAYAESGRFDDAIATAERGREFAEREGNRELADEFVGVLARYRQHQPMRDASLELHED